MLLTGIDSSYDEKFWGLDSSSLNASSYRLQTYYLSRGTIAGVDTDYYQITIPYSGDFQIILSNDPVNNWGAVWSKNFVYAAIVDSQGTVQSGFETIAYDATDGVIFFNWNGGYSTDLNLKIYGTANASYVVTLTPLDDEEPQYVSIEATDASKNEGNSGETAFTFTVTRDSDVGAPSVDWAVVGSGDDPADGADFAGGALPTGTVTFADGETSKTITVNVQGDMTVEADECFSVTLSNPVGMVLDGDASVGAGTITNDDIGGNSRIWVTAIDAVKHEGHSG
ncbi:MAG: Calx-beta domain-containing protein, partial [Desulfurivibrionaceae bacterium]